MSLKSIRESYSKLLTAFSDAGVKLNESQKSDIDSFVMALESTMSTQRQNAIRQTKKAVEAKLEKEYSALFESIMDNVAKNTALESKIRVARAKIDESKKVSSKVSDYLDLYVESVLPKKTIVDYDRMHKLEQIHESLKNALLIDEDSVAQKKQELDESYKKVKGKLETEVAKMQVKLNKSLAKQNIMEKKLNQYKAMALLESKTEYLPSYEATQVKKMLSESTVSEIEDKFDDALKQVREQSKEICTPDQKTVDEEINSIVNDNVDEDDILKTSPHNGNGNAHNGHKLDEEDFETTENIDVDENGDVVLDEDDVIDENAMRRWCAQANM